MGGIPTDLRDSKRAANDFAILLFRGPVANDFLREEGAR